MGRRLNISDGGMRKLRFLRDCSMEEMAEMLLVISSHENSTGEEFNWVYHGEIIREKFGVYGMEAVELMEKYNDDEEFARKIDKILAEKAGESSQEEPDDEDWQDVLRSMS